MCSRPSSKHNMTHLERTKCLRYALKCEGPYIIRIAYNSGYLLISEFDLEDFLSATNVK